MDWLVFVANLIVTGILLYAVQKTLDERASKRLEKFKDEIRAGAFERETRFTKLHEERAEVIVKLYRKLVKIERRLSSYAYNVKSSEASCEETEKSIWDAIHEFQDYFLDNRLYLPETLGGRVEEFHQLSSSAYVTLQIADIAKMSSSNDESYDREYKEEFTEASRIISEEIPPLKEEIELEFRRLLGG
jgi:hypothetical protein